MSISKLDFSYIKQNHSGYTVILNDVIQYIDDVTVLSLYVYLSSLPSDWHIQKSHLRKKFKIGINKLDNALAWMFKHKLLTYHRDRDNNGKLKNGYIEVNDGSIFISNQKL